MKAAIIGHPVAHSKSPIIHRYWMDNHGIEGQYDKINIAPEDLPDKLKKIIADDYDGFNVTAPHKESILKYCDEIDDTARMIGAANTIIIKDQKLIGKNTDAYGFIQNIKSSVPSFDFKNKTACVLGAGGAARAVIYGLVEAGVAQIKLTNRTIEKAQELQLMAPDKITVVPWDMRHHALEGVDLLANTTALGMVGKDPLELDLSALPADALVNDIVYAPLMTDLLNDAQTRGNTVVTGIGMLLHQARPAFESWTGILPRVTKELQQDILK